MRSATGSDKTQRDLGDASVARGWNLRDGVVGGAAIAFGMLVVIENAVLAGAGAPAFGDAMEEVFAHYQNRGAVSIAVGLVAVYVPLLLVFLTGFHGIVGRRGGAGAEWSRLAVAAGASFSATFAFVNVLQIGLVLSAAGLVEPSPAFELAWQVHSAAFALSLPALGTMVIGAALAGYASRLTPRWQYVLGVAGGVLLLIAGVGSVAIADGSALLFIGLLGFAAWLVWLGATGVRLVARSK